MKFPLKIHRMLWVWENRGLDKMSAVDDPSVLDPDWDDDPSPIPFTVDELYGEPVISARDAVVAARRLKLQRDQAQFQEVVNRWHAVSWRLQMRLDRAVTSERKRLRKFRHRLRNASVRLELCRRMILHRANFIWPDLKLRVR